MARDFNAYCVGGYFVTGDERLKRNAYMRDWNSKNRERVNAKNRAKHAEDPERKRQYMREWGALNKEKKAEHDRRYYERNSEKLKTKAASWYGANYERARANQTTYYANNRDKVLAQQAEWRLLNPEEAKRQRKVEYYAHQEAYAARGRRWRDANALRCKENREAWKKANWGAVLAHCAARKCAKLQRTPLWADMDAIEAIYTACPSGYHVDHVIPLRGKLVSGLHVENNLQYLPAVENLRKANKLMDIAA